MRMTFITHELGCGGAERVLCVVANYWAERGHAVNIVTTSSALSSFSLHPDIQHTGLGLAGVSRNLQTAVVANFRRLTALRRAVVQSRPQVVISFSFQSNVLTVLATRGLKVPAIICEHTDMHRFHAGPVWRALQWITYPLADVVTCLTPNILEDMQLLVGNRGLLLPNPVAVPPAHVCALELPAGHLLVAMGRLHPVKGFDSLLEAFAPLSPKHRDWHLLILGEGSEREHLKRLIHTHGLEGRATLYGHVSDPFPILRRAELFVLSSSREGFPMALCEAMACGVPVVSFDCRSGPNYIIHDGHDGLLVPPGNVLSLSRSIERLMIDEEERRRLGSNAREVLNRFSVETVLGMWSQMFSRLGVGPV
jgi:GalNAc-alpha-(1->4)-GalNAc-alpha-(1->3)-diNAcBac-PP-undecaprenol alpha-1,4-N-acetyl-D-galactosaminyltransferase